MKSHMSNIHPDKFFPKASKSNNRFASSRLSLGRLKPTTKPLVSKGTGSVETKKKSKESEKTAQCTVCQKVLIFYSSSSCIIILFFVLFSMFPNRF